MTHAVFRVLAHVISEWIAVILARHGRAGPRGRARRRHRGRAVAAGRSTLRTASLPLRTRMLVRDAELVQRRVIERGQDIEPLLVIDVAERLFVHAPADAVEIVLAAG